MDFVFSPTLLSSLPPTPNPFSCSGLCSTYYFCCYLCFFLVTFVVNEHSSLATYILTSMVRNCRRTGNSHNNNSLCLPACVLLCISVPPSPHRQTPLTSPPSPGLHHRSLKPHTANIHQHCKDTVLAEFCRNSMMSGIN